MPPELPDAPDENASRESAYSIILKCIHEAEMGKWEDPALRHARSVFDQKNYEDALDSALYLAWIYAGTIDESRIREALDTLLAPEYSVRDLDSITGRTETPDGKICFQHPLRYRLFHRKITEKIRNILERKNSKNKSE